MPEQEPAGEPPRKLPNDSQAMAVALVGPGRRVLELGCGAGHVTRRLQEAGCAVTAIEIDPDAASEASRWAATVHVADLDTTTPRELLGEQTFERIVVGDVFEHLRDPRTTLEALATHLDPGGHLVASIPNVTHADVRLMLLGGAWRYQDLGLLDRTHLRFFDHRGVLELFGDAGWSIQRLERTTKQPLESELADLARPAASTELLDSLASDPEATTYQFVVVAQPGAAHAVPPVPGKPTGAPGALAVGGPTGRLQAENDRLRVRVRELEEMLEDAHWSAAVWRRRLRRAAALPARLGARLRREPPAAQACSGPRAPRPGSGPGSPR